MLFINTDAILLKKQTLYIETPILPDVRYCM